MSAWAPGVEPANFVGREAERRALDAALARALRFAAPQLVTVSGPLGIGKSRLIAEWARGVEAGGAFRVVRVATPAPADRPPSPGAVLGAVLTSRLGVGEGDTDGALAALRAELPEVLNDRRVAEVAALLGGYLGVEASGTPLTSVLVTRPDTHADLAQALLGRFLEEDARRRPLAIIIDDLHVADDTSLDVLARLGSAMADAPIAIVVAARPELFVRRPDWGRGEGSQVRIDVGPLSPLQMEVFVRSTLAGADLDAQLAARAAVESGGNPRLLDRLLAAYRSHGAIAANTVEAAWFEAGAGDDADASGTAAPAARDTLPEALALSRLMTLSPAERGLLDCAAVFGPTFWTGGVVALGRLGAEPRDPATVFAPDPSIDEVRRLLASLAERRFVVRQPESAIPGEAEWSFVDAHERQLLAAGADPETERRRKRFAAQWIESRAGGLADAGHLERVARLCEEGADPRRAAQAFLAAAGDAERHGRLEHARTLYLHGVRLLDTDDSLLKLDASYRLGAVAARLGRGREALAHFGEMLRVAWRLDLPAKGGAAHARIGRLRRTAGEYVAALKHLDLARVLFDLAGDRPGLAAALDDMGRVHFLGGASTEAMRCHDAAMALREALRDERGKAITLSWMGLVRAQAGDLAGARQHFLRALAIGRAVRDPRGVALALLDLAGIEIEIQRGAGALDLLREARKLARRAADGLCDVSIGIRLGDALRLEGELDEAEHELKASREMARKFGARRLVAEADRGLAEVALAAGDLLAARDRALGALAAAESLGVPVLAGTALGILATAVARGAPGDADRGGPREMLDRAVDLLGRAGAELAIGRVLVAGVEMERAAGRDEAAAAMLAEARAIRDRAWRPLDPQAAGPAGTPRGAGAPQAARASVQHATEA